jgi:pimeloyl-ACP methyl ester carboxylesterase
MPMIKASELMMHYDSYGEGPPLVLLHGLGYQGAYWWLQVETFAQRYRVIVPDNRGVGLTETPDGDWSTAIMADDTAHLLTALGVPRAHVLGVSMGGAIAQQLAVRHPDQIDRLILACTWCQASLYGNEMLTTWRVVAEQAGTAAWKRVMLVQYVTPGFYSDHPDRVTKMQALAEAPCQSLAGFLRQNWACVHHQTTELLPQVPVPTLVLAAEHDRLTPVGGMKFLHRQMARSQFVVLPRCGHGFMWEIPEQFNTAVLEFLGP